MPYRHLTQLSLVLLSLGCQACKTTSNTETKVAETSSEGAPENATSKTPSSGTQPDSWAPDVLNTSGTQAASGTGTSQIGDGEFSTSGIGTRQLSGLGQVELLDVNYALWGVDLPNSVKGITVAWDPVASLLYSASITNRWLMVSRPDDGHPYKAIDLEVAGSHTNRMVIDAQRRHLFWVDNTSETIRVIDLDTQTVLHRHDPSDQYKGYPVQGIALDSSTGWIWVVNKEHKRVKGYSPDFSQSASIAGLSDPVAIDAEPGGDGFFILDSTSKTEGRLVHYQPSSSTLSEIKSFSGKGRPPRYVAATSDGHAVVASRGLLAVDRSGAELWRARLPHPAVGVASTADVVVALVSSSEAPARAREQHGFSADAKDQVVVFNAQTGAQKSEATLRYEARRMTLDEAGRRAFIGNGGDGSVSIVGLDQAGLPRLIDVANAAEGTVVDSKSGRRFVLNRLGGSEIYAWDSQGLARFAALPWPFELAIDTTRRQLIAVSYYEAKVYRWDLDSQEALPSIELGIPNGTGDTLGDISYDPESGNLVVALPQEGWMALANLDSGTTTWTHQVEGMQLGDHAGPGRGMVAIGSDRVFIIGGKPTTATSLSLSSGTVQRSASLASKDRRVRSAYRLNTVYYDRAGDRVFYGNQVLDPDSLQVERSLDKVDKIFYADESQVLAMDVDGSTEYLLRLDPGSLAEKDRWAVTQSEVIRTEATYDPTRNAVLISDLPNAEVMVIPLP